MHDARLQIQFSSPANKAFVYGNLVDDVAAGFEVQRQPVCGDLTQDMGG